MGEFINFITKGIEFEKDGDRRIFSGHITAEIVDHQNEFIFIKEVMDVMETFMKVLPVLSEAHSNRMIGKVLSYEKSEIEGHESVKITAEVFKQDGVTLYDNVWNKIKTNVYSGLSMGGGSKNRDTMFKDGRMVMKLSDLELYEIAVCPSPANPLAIIDKYNQFAKSDFFQKANDIDDRRILQCSSVSCYFGKGIDDNVDLDLDNDKNANLSNEEKANIHQKLPKPGEIHLNVNGDKININKESQDVVLGTDTRRPNRNPLIPSPEIKERANIMGKQEVDQSKAIVDDKGDIGEKAKDFDEPKIEKHHIPGFPEDVEEKARKKNEELSKTIALNHLKYQDEIIKEKEQKIKDLSDKLKIAP